MIQQQRIDTVAALVESVSRSLDRYEAVRKKNGRRPEGGYDLPKWDSRESIRRRITVIREELLRISDML